MALTNEQINNIADNCKYRYFQVGDDEGYVRLNFARAIEAACQANDVDFPVLRIIDDHLKNGASIEMRDDKVCLIRADGEVIARGKDLKTMLIEAVFTLC